jgi:hypothetical protein
MSSGLASDSPNTLPPRVEPLQDRARSLLTRGRKAWWCSRRRPGQGRARARIHLSLRSKKMTGVMPTAEGCSLLLIAAVTATLAISVTRSCEGGAPRTVRRCGFSRSGSIFSRMRRT